MKEQSMNKITGHVVIRDRETQAVLVDTHNDINYETFSIMLAQGASHSAEGYINEMVFGNGGAVVSPVGAVTYLPPNTQGQGASLYNQTYNKVINSNSNLNTDPTRNNITVLHTPGALYSDIQITCTLGLSEPASQSAFDNATDFSGAYVFNELGLRTRAAAVNQGNLITHVIFNPIQKSLNREIEVVYTLRIQTA
jgi:hypothetical protein